MQSPLPLSYRTLQHWREIISAQLNPRAPARPHHEEHGTSGDRRDGFWQSRSNREQIHGPMIRNQVAGASPQQVKITSPTWPVAPQGKSSRFGVSR